ncbi:MAG: polysaccharide deacetylase family protein [Bacteroidales bacterium]|nr:polysaccharide deacetylase family protein [Bacteroidales bacterium]
MKEPEVFCFHRISDEVSPAYQPIPPKTFDKIISYLSKKYFIVPINDISSKNTTNKPKAVITFDDAYYDFYEYALPILDKYKIPSVQHVITSCANDGKTFWTQRLNKIIDSYFFHKKNIRIPDLNIELSVKSYRETQMSSLKLYYLLLDNPNRSLFIENIAKNAPDVVEDTKMMNWDNIKDCMKYNVLFGSHTHTHQNLSVLNEVDLHNEIGLSVGSIRSKIGNCVSLAFPNGYYSVDTIKVALDYNVPFLFTTEKEHLIPNVNANIITRYSLYHTEWWKNYIRLRFLI